MAVWSGGSSSTAANFGTHDGSSHSACNTHANNAASATDVDRRVLQGSC